MKNEWISLQDVIKFEAISKSAMTKRLHAGFYRSEHLRKVKGKGGKDGQRTEIHVDALSPDAQARYFGTPDTEPHPLPPLQEERGKSRAAHDQYWLTAIEAARLENTSPKSIKRHCQNGKIRQFRQAPVSGDYQIHLHSLSPHAQWRWYIEHNLPAPQALQNQMAAPLDEIAEADRAKGVTWLDHIHRVDALRLRSGDTLHTTIAAYVDGLPFSAATLAAKYRAFQQHGITALVPKTGQRGRKALAIPGNLKSFLYQHYLTSPLPNRALSARACIARAAQQDLELAASARTLIRLLEHIPTDIRVKYQQGRKALANAIPSLERAYEFAPMYVWVADHHQFNVAVRAPSGSIVFPWLTAWEDMKSRKLMGWQIVIQPNSDSIAFAFYLGVKQYGAPEHLLLDNGKDFKCYRLAGSQIKSKKFRPVDESEAGYLRGAFTSAGVQQIHFAIPYNAKSKPIERYFRTMNEQCVAQLPGYRGRNVTERPEKLAQEAAQGNLLTLTEFTATIDRYITEIYHQAVHTGHGMHHRSPDQVFAEERLQAGYVPEENLRLLLMRLGKQRIIQKNGIEIFDQFYRLAPELHLQYKGAKVWVRYHPQDIGAKVHVYAVQGDVYLGEAHIAGRAKFTDADAIKTHKHELKLYDCAMRDYYDQQELKMVAVLGVEERIGLPPANLTPNPSPESREGHRGADAKVVTLTPRIQAADAPPVNPTEGNVLEFPGKLHDLPQPPPESGGARGGQKTRLVYQLDDDDDQDGGLSLYDLEVAKRREQDNNNEEEPYAE